MGPFQDFDTLPFRSFPTWQSFLTVYLSPPCWTMQSWRMSSFSRKAFHPLMNRPMTTCSMNNLPHTTIPSSLSIIFPFIQHTPRLKIITLADKFRPTFDLISSGPVSFSSALSLFLFIFFHQSSSIISIKYIYIYYHARQKIFQFHYFSLLAMNISQSDQSSIPNAFTSIKYSSKLSSSSRKHSFHFFRFSPSFGISQVTRSEGSPLSLSCRAATVTCHILRAVLKLSSHLRQASRMTESCTLMTSVFSSPSPTIWGMCTSLSSTPYSIGSASTTSSV